MNILLITSQYLPIFNKTNEGAIEKLERIYLKFNASTSDHFTVYSPKIAKDNYDRIRLKNCEFRPIDLTTPSSKLRRYLYAIKKRLTHQPGNENYIRQIIKDLKGRKEEDAYDLIIFENGQENIPIFRHHTNTSTKIVLHLHNDYLNPTYPNAKDIIKNTDEFWTVSNFIKDQIRAVSPDITAHTLLNTWSFGGKTQAYPSKKSDNLTTLLYVGRIIEVKGVKELILAFRKTYENNSNLRLLIAGKPEPTKASGAYLSECQALAEGYPIEFLGFVPPEKLPSIYQQADIQVVPSKWNEAFGLILLEGMAHNLRIISTGTGGIREIGRNLITYVNRDNLVEDLTNAILEEATKPPLNKSYYETVLKDFSEEKFCNRFYTLIHQPRGQKIGVVTFVKSENYGAFLQAYALQSVLKNLGHHPSLIDYETPADKKRYCLLKTSSLKAFLRSLFLLPTNLRRKRAFGGALKTLNFTQKTTPYNLAIAGSDQIWNPKLTGNKPDPVFFLNGISAGQKISYATSIGNIKNLTGNRTTIRKYLKNFDKISVRETSAKTAITPLTDKGIAITLDPTLLLKREEWQKIIQDIKNPLEGTDYILTYFIGGVTEDQNSALTLVSKKLNLKVLSYSERPKEKNLLKHCYSDSPLEFLVKLRDAKLVLTSSFHGTVLSIILHKNFYYFLPNPEKRSRVDHILNLLGLNSRIIESRDDLKKITLKDIDYRGSDKKLDQLRQTSLDWLKAAINGQKAQPTPKAQSLKAHRPKTKPAQRSQK